MDELQQSIDMSKATPIKCDKCENNTFKQTLVISKLSALLAPNGQEQYIPSAVFACEACSHVNEEFVTLSKQQ